MFNSDLFVTVQCFNFSAVSQPLLRGLGQAEAIQKKHCFLKYFSPRLLRHVDPRSDVGEGT